MGTQVAQKKLFGFGISKGLGGGNGSTIGGSGGGSKGKEVISNQGGVVASGSGIKKVSAEVKKKPTLTQITTNDYSLFQTTTSTNNKNSAPTTPNSKSKSSSSSPSKPTTDDMPHHYLPSITSDQQSGESNWTDLNWLKENTALNPNFLKTYFNQSRLSHLSIWKQELITLANDLQLSRSPSTFSSTSRSTSLKGKNKKRKEDDDSRIIMHVDFDCFFVSAGLIDRPELIGKPVAVCHTDGNMESRSSTSEIASCSYEARAKGVVNGMSYALFFLLFFL